MVNGPGIVNLIGRLKQTEQPENPALSKPSQYDESDFELLEDRFHRPRPQNTMFQLLEIKPVQVAAVIMNVIFPAYFSVGRDVHSRFDL